MDLERSKRRSFILTAVILFVLFLIQYSGALPKINGACPFNLLLPIVIFAGMFFGEWYGAIIGVITGVFADAVSADIMCFNTIAFLIIGCAAGLLITYFFNNTVISAFIINLIFIALFESARFFTFFISIGFSTAAYHFTNLTVPSFFCTLILSVPMYFGYRKLIKIVNR